MKTTKKYHKSFNNLNDVSNHLKNILGILLVAVLIFTNYSCSKSEGGIDTSTDCNDNDACVRPTAAEFTDIRNAALIGKTQVFSFNAEDGFSTFTSENGVTIYINGSCLTDNGNPVTGPVDLEYVEIFEKGTMLVTNKPTMGRLPSGDKALIISGGEFFVEASQNGNVLEASCPFQLLIPGSLTGGVNPNMTLWSGDIDAEGNLTWDEEAVANPNQEEGVFMEGDNYFTTIGDFGWTNVDIFFSDPRPKTTLQVQAPEGYDNDNSAIYLSYDGEAPALAHLDVYDSNLDIFSEHYGQIPIGLECHVIFVSESNGEWRYAIKPVTIEANDIITFTIEETEVGTENTLVDLINNLP